MGLDLQARWPGEEGRWEFLRAVILSQAWPSRFWAADQRGLGIPQDKDTGFDQRM